MNDPVLDSAFLELAAEYAIKHSEQDTHPDGMRWDQNNYRLVGTCKTMMCLAGFTCELSGGHWIENDTFMSDYLYIEPDDDTDIQLQYDGHSVIQAGDRAQRLLGLTPEERAYLFDGGYNGADELRTRVKSVINGELR